MREEGFDFARIRQCGEQDSILGIETWFYFKTPVYLGQGQSRKR